MQHTPMMFDYRRKAAKDEVTPEEQAAIDAYAGPVTKLPPATYSWQMRGEDMTPETSWFKREKEKKKPRSKRVDQCVREMNYRRVLVADMMKELDVQPGHVPSEKTEEMARKCGCSDRTIRNDIAAIRQEQGE